MGTRCVDRLVEQAPVAAPAGQLRAIFPVRERISPCPGKELLRGRR